MNEQTRIHLTNLQNKLKEISRYSHCARLMSFDRETIAPKDALENENETLDFLYAKIFEIKKTKKYEESIVYLHDHIDELEPLDQRLITLYIETMKTILMLHQNSMQDETRYLTKLMSIG